MSVPRALRNVFLSSVLVLALLVISNYSWVMMTNQEVIPFRLYLPLCTFVMDRYIFPKGRSAKYPQVLTIFTDNKELKNLAIPPKYGGPKQQMAFILLGFGQIIALILIAIPSTPTQVIGLMVSLSSTLGFVMYLHNTEGIAYLDLSLPIYSNLAVNVAGLIFAIL